MKYYFYVDETHEVFETAIYSVDAESLVEAEDKFNNNDCEYIDTINTDYGDCLDSTLSKIEDEHDNVLFEDGKYM